MRITNSMMVNTLNRNVASNLNRMDLLQNQMATGRKFANISDDPVALIYSQSARNMMTRIANFQRSAQTAGNWLRAAEDAIMDTQRTLVDLYVETVNAASDTKGTGEDADKRNIAPAIAQLKKNIVDNLNVTMNNRFMFGGHNTPGDPAGPAHIQDQSTRAFTVENEILHFNGFNISQFDGMPAAAFNYLFNHPQPPDAAALATASGPAMNPPIGDPPTAFDFGAFTLADMQQMHRLMNDVPTFVVGPGIEMPVTANGIDLALFMTPALDEEGNPLTTADGTRVMVMRNVWNVADDLHRKVDAGLPAEQIAASIRPLQDAQNHLLTRTADIGGRVRRLEMLEARYENDLINYERMRSEAEDVDFAESIMNFRMAEAVYQAALSAGARIIQPTLMDFLR